MSGQGRGAWTGGVPAHIHILPCQGVGQLHHMAEHPIPNKVWLCWEAQEDGTGAVAAVAVPGVVDLPPPRQRGNVCKAARGRPPAGICVPLPVMCKRLILRRGGGTGMGNRRTHGDTGHRRLRGLQGRVVGGHGPDPKAHTAL